MPKNNKLTIFDADSIVYTVAYTFRNKKVKSMVEMQVNKFISDVLQNTNATHYVGFYGSAEEGALPNFRFDVDPKYKGNRPPTPDFVKKWRPTIHKVFKEKWGFIPIDGMEADDAATIAAETHKNDYAITIATFDKDLRQVSNSTFYDMRLHKADVISYLDGIKSLGKQLLMGDTSDNIPGLPGVGKKSKLLVAVDECKTEAEVKWLVARSYFNVYDETKRKALINITREIKLSISEVELAEDIPALFKGLSGPRLDRRIRIESAARLDAILTDKFPTGIRGYYKQQEALLRMLTVAPDGFVLPDVRENPFAAVQESEEVTVVSASAIDDFLVI